MRGRRAFRRCGVVAACVSALLGLASSAGGAVRDDSAWLQAKLDAGGAIFLPRLPSGQCYATRGLWVSRDDTTVTSDGACIVALGRGEGRIQRGDGTFVTANAVFSIDHSELRKPLPVRIAISGLHITVPAGKRMNGISVLGHEVTLSRPHDRRFAAHRRADRRRSRRVRGDDRPDRADGLEALRRRARRRFHLRAGGPSCRGQCPHGRAGQVRRRSAHPRRRPRAAHTRRTCHWQQGCGQQRAGSLPRPCACERLAGAGLRDRDRAQRDPRKRARGTQAITRRHRSERWAE